MSLYIFNSRSHLFILFQLDLQNRRILPKYRTILVDYMVDMQMQYGLFPETLFLGVFMLDKYLEVSFLCLYSQTDTKKIQLNSL